MKYIYSIILALCCFYVLTACSDKDNEKGISQLPVTNIKLPTTIKPGEVLTIQGKGFTDASRIYLQSVIPLPMERTAVSNASLTIQIPEDLETGVYFVYLQESVQAWEIGRIAVITNLTSPVSEIVVPTQATAGDLLTVKGKGFDDNCKFTIVGPASEYEVEITHRNGNSLTLRLPVMLKTTDYTLLLRQGEQWELGTIRINAKTTPARLARIVHIREESDGTKSSDTTAFMYRDNKLESLITSDEYSSQKYTYTYEEEMITVDEYYFSMPYPDPDDPDSDNQEGYWELSNTFSYTLTNGCVSSHEFYGESFEWNYNQENYLTSLIYGDNSIAYNYQGHNLLSLIKDEWGSKLTYTFTYTNEVKNDRPGIDMMAPLLYLLNENTAEYQARLLNICGTIPALLPSEITIKDMWGETIYNFTYQTINGYISKILKTGVNSAKETYEISYE